MSDPRRRGVLNGVLAALVLALVVTAIGVLAKGPAFLPDGMMSAKKPTSNEQTLLAYDAVLATAEEWTADFLSVDYRKMDPIFTRVLAGTAPPFREEYERSEASVKQLSKENRSISTGEIFSVGVSELEGDTAKVFVAANSRVQNKSTKKPQTRYYRIELQMTRQGGNWLISGLKFVG